MNKYSLSIIVPHYNSPLLLKKLLDSIGNHSDVEIIVIDDNSTNEMEEYRLVEEAYKREGVHFLLKLELRLKKLLQVKGAYIV